MIHVFTNEYPGVRAGGIGMYISGLKTVLGDRLTVTTMTVFPRRLRLLRFLWRATRRGDAIWIHHVFPLGLPTLFLRFLGGRSYTVFLHGNDFDTAYAHPVRRLLLACILRGARRIIVNSHALARDMSKVSSKKPVVLLPWLPRDAEDALGLSSRPEKTILTIGRFVPRKGFGLLLDVAAKMPMYRFIFAAPENAYGLRLQKEARARVLTNIRFVFNPTREEILSLYGEASIFAMPTIKTPQDREGFGIVYLEAQYAGLPILAVDWPETREALMSALTLAHRPDPDVIIRIIPTLEDFKNQDALRTFVKKYHTLDSRHSLIEDIAK